MRNTTPVDAYGMPVSPATAAGAAVPSRRADSNAGGASTTASASNRPPSPRPGRLARDRRLAGGDPPQVDHGGERVGQLRDAAGELQEHRGAIHLVGRGG